MFFQRRQLEAMLFIGLGAIVGANLRYWLSGWIAQQVGASFPWGTLVINFTGSLILATFVTWSSRRMTLDPNVRLLVSVGFCGGYTTFSTYASESVAMLQAGSWLGALTNFIGTNLLGLIAVFLGLFLGSKL